MKKKRIFLGLLLLLIAVFSLVGCRKHVSVQLFNYEENEDGTVTITGLTDKAKEDLTIKVPEKLDGKTVSAIGTGTFRDHTSVTKVVIAEGITSIGDNAFLNCYALVEIEIPSTVKTIGTNAFTNTKWEADILAKGGDVIVNNILCKVKSAKDEYTVPGDVVTIASGVFYNNKTITKVNLPAGLEGIGNYAFAGCEAIKEISLPEGLKEIGYGAFADSGIKKIYVPSTVQVIGNEAFLNIEEVDYKGSAEGSPWGAAKK